jgi:D-alanine-D-alanine ligase
VTTVLVLGGGPDAERAVSIESAKGVAEALRRAAKHAVEYREIGRATLDELRALPGDVVFPVLHGPWGEGGPLQELLDRLGRPYVGSCPRASRACMDKVLTKSTCVRAGVTTTRKAIFNGEDPVCPLPFPVVVKPVHEGSSVGLRIVRTDAEWESARAMVLGDRKEHPSRTYFIEPFVSGREITAGVLDPGGPGGGQTLPLVEIIPAEGVYDYEAKYTREDTKYVPAPALQPGVTMMVQQLALRAAHALGVRHLCRVDFILDHLNAPWLLEVNTMPGFTSHSLLPMAAAKAGMPMPALCAKLVTMALRDGARG